VAAEAHAVTDAPRQPVRHFRDCVLAIGIDEIGQRGKQRGIGEHLRLDAVMQRLFPRVENILERRLLSRSTFRGMQFSPFRAQFLTPLATDGN